ncbi:hypothetical protein ACHAXM_002895 [Skeletonema potamos]
MSERELIPTLGTKRLPKRRVRHSGRVKPKSVKIFTKTRIRQCQCSHLHQRMPTVSWKYRGKDIMDFLFRCWKRCTMQKIT